MSEKIIKILSISEDRSIFDTQSAVYTRVCEYAQKVGEYHIVVFTTKEFVEEKKLGTEVRIAPNVFVYPTCSLSKWTYVWDAIVLGKRIVKDKNFVLGETVVTCQDPFECGFVGWRITQEYNFPLHLQIHTDFLSPYFKTSTLQIIRVMCARFILPYASGIRVVSKRIADSISSLGLKLKVKPVILPIRIDTEKIEKAQKIDLYSLYPQFKFFVLMASRLTVEKRIQDGLHAFASIVARYPFACLLIAGEGPEKENLEKLSRDLGIDSHVVFLGFRGDTPSLLKSVNMFMSTSKFEGYGMSLIEAGLCFCPVVTTPVGVVGNILKNDVNALVCPVGDSECFAEKIFSIMSENVKREILTGRLSSDVRQILSEKKEYTDKFIKGIIDTLHHHD